MRLRPQSPEPIEVEAPDRFDDRLPKLIGADVELGNFLVGGDPLDFATDRRGKRENASGTGGEAARLLLREILGLPCGGRRPRPICDCRACRERWQREAERARSRSEESDLNSRAAASPDAEDVGRRFLPTNGGCAYIDRDHLELCTPEVRSAHDFVAAWHAMLEIGRQALGAAQARRPNGQRLHVLVNNSDGQGNSYGSHLSVLVSRRCWDNIFGRRVLQLPYLASFQASSILVTGQGKVGSENGTPDVDFQIAQRADFLETLCGSQTTHRRPIVNSRDEPLCGDSADRFGARLHVIFYDSTLCHAATLLKVGLLQIVAAQLEAEQLEPSVIIDDPVAAVVRWSHDPTLRTAVRLASGRKTTLVEHQERCFDALHEFVEAGGCDGLVPHAGEIVALWGDTLARFRAGDEDALAARIDWVLKRRVLERVMRQKPQFSWQSPELKHLDHLYSSLDLGDGLYWACERAGVVDRVVNAERVACFTQSPPPDTRARARAMLLRQLRPAEVEDVDWDRIWLTTGGGTRRVVKLPDPLQATRQEEDSSTDNESGQWSPSASRPGEGFAGRDADGEVVSLSRGG